MGMDRRTFSQWLKATRDGLGYSQGELGALIGMERTYVNELENNPRKWPKPATRARFHAVFGTSDEDLVAAGVATRKEYPRPSGGARVVYLPAAREAGEAPPTVMPSLAGVPAELADMLGRIAWTPEHVAALEPVLRMLVRSTEAISAPAPAGTPAAPPPAAAPSGRSEGR
jgi:transcriptional regulator with XRE-family HTH domain